MKKEQTYIKAKYNILNYILNFYTCKSYHINFGVDKDTVFLSDLSGLKPPIGTLVILTSAPVSEFYLSWLIEIRQNESRFSTEYLLKSIDTGKLCWWSNVGFYYLPLSVVEKFPMWKWSDDKFVFYEKWNRLINRHSDYNTMGCLPVFNDNGSVVLSTRIKFSDTIIKKQEFPDWKKLTQKEIINFIKNN